MPTIKQLPAALAVSPNDILPVSQNGLTRALSVGVLQSNVQPLLSLMQGNVLGRSSAGAGQPEPLSVGIGLSLTAGTFAATGGDHAAFPMGSALLSGDEIIVNSNSAPKRMPAVQFRSLFSAGSGIAIDQSGVISALGGSGGSGTQGPKGETGPQGANGQGFTFRGSWQANTSYSPYDVVTYAGQSYVTTTAFVSGANFSPTGLSLVAAQGAIGPAGATGATGPSGPITPASVSAIGAVKPGSGLAIVPDGTLSIGSVSPALISQSGATTGQLLGWTGTSWAPTSTTVSSYVGSTPIAVASGVISLAQNGATTGQILAWNGSSWMPQAPVAGAGLGNAVPSMDGVGTAGTSTSAARDDHRHPVDVTRAPLANPAFVGSITLPSWTTSSRPTSPVLGMEGYATDIGRRETYTGVGWIQYARVSDIQAAAGQLFGGTGVAGATVPISLGTGLSLSSGTLSVTGGSYMLPPATTTSLGGVKSDGSTVQVGGDGTLSVNAVAVTALTDVSSGALGGPALSDVDTVNRSGTDYRTTLAARNALFRKTPAGSRTITMASNSAVATLTSTDHDKTVVISGMSGGSLSVDGSITDGFRGQVINHTGAALSLSGITGLGASSLANAASCWVTLANSAVEATFPGGASAYTLSPASTSALGGIKPDGTSLVVAGDGTLSVVTVSTHGLAAGSGLVGVDELAVFSISGTADVRYTVAQIAAFTQSNVQSWTTATRPSLALSQYATGYNTTLGRFDFWNGSAWIQHCRTTDVSAPAGQLLGGSGTSGVVTAISIGPGLSLSGSTLALSGGGTVATPAITVPASGTGQSLAFPASGSRAYDVTLSGNCVFNLSGGTTGELQTITLVVRGGNGGFSASLPGNVKWPGGTTPLIDGSAGSYNEFYIRTIDGGATYSGNY